MAKLGFPIPSIPEPLYEDVLGELPESAMEGGEGLECMNLDELM